MNKIDSREYALSIRKKSYDIETVIPRLDKIIKNLKIVGIYYPLKGEVSLLPLVKLYPNIKFVYPKIIGDKLEFRALNDSGFSKGRFNTMEPQGERIEMSSIDLIFVPCVAINKEGYRLGYGKGYYDKTLNNYNNTATVIDKCLVLDFDASNHDIKIKKVLLI